MKIPQKNPPEEFRPWLRDMLVVTHSRAAMIHALGGEIPVVAAPRSGLDGASVIVAAAERRFVAGAR